MVNERNNQIADPQNTLVKCIRNTWDGFVDFPFSVKSSLVAIIAILIAIPVITGANFTTDKRQHADSVTPKLVLADFYWWYPWYGMQYKDQNGVYQPAKDVNGYVEQDAFYVHLTQPIPYLYSSEHPQGPVNDAAAVTWFEGNFERAADSGINVMAVMTRPDLANWKHAVTLMIQAQKDLQAQNKKFPKLLFQLDGVEYWDKVSPSTGQLTGPGQDYDVILQGVKDTFDAVNSTLSQQEIPTYLQMNDSSTFPIMVYRIEGNAQNFTTSDWWVTQLKSDFSSAYPGKSLYVILDQYWCNATYGVNNSVQTHTCNGDNYYFWGGALSGAVVPSYSHSPLIISIGPGFNNGGTIQPRNNGAWYQSNFNQAISDGVDWLLLETFNFGEEGTVIDQSTEYGTQYLDLTQQFSAQFLPPPTPTQLPTATPQVTVSPVPTKLPTSTQISTTPILPTPTIIKINTPTPTVVKIMTPTAIPPVQSSGSGNTIPGDINHDGHVNSLDTQILFSEYNQCKPNLPADINHDGCVNAKDAIILINNFGK